MAMVAPWAPTTPSSAMIVGRTTGEPNGRSWNLESLACASFFIRDVSAGALRYYTTIYGVGPIWFIPDMLAIMCLVMFAYRHILIERSSIAIFLLLYTIFSLVESYIVLGNFSAVASAFKMILPVFVGFCFAGRNIGSYSKLLKLCHFLFYFSVFGIILSSVQQLPWVGFTYESFGAVREAGRLWWTENEVRLSGFAGDNTMAAFFVLLTFVIASLRRSVLWCVICGGAGIYALVLSTSKTCLSVFLIYLPLLFVVRALPPIYRFAVVRQMGLVSFGAILIPFVLIGLMSGIDLTKIDPALFSMQDRINNSWQLPFVYMMALAPTGYVFGCGLGCFNYPQELFSPHLAGFMVPVDNFYLGTYLMFGIPSLVFIFYAVIVLSRSDDAYRYTLALILNLFTITVLSYGPSSALLVLGIVFSDVFTNGSPAKSASFQRPDRLSTPLRT